MYRSIAWLIPNSILLRGLLQTVAISLCLAANCEHKSFSNRHTRSYTHTHAAKHTRSYTHPHTHTENFWFIFLATWNLLQFESNNFPSPSAPIEMGWWWVWVTACLPAWSLTWWYMAFILPRSRIYNDRCTTTSADDVDLALRCRIFVRIIFEIESNYEERG